MVLGLHLDQENTAETLVKVAVKEKVMDESLFFYN